ncbi:COP1-interacting protein 7 isoform X3 [Lactuca sativa]|uniref:COP1-interacting protein 7 isoform X3 n=1 Tax=Lactuca sativa TaxID=4236 RepID=UPI000CD847BF|nr:COP1-interacting protein 7 isoform X3 [Lactuca sativa]
MKSKTRLDSAVFQLTPTRTRCDLYIIANDKKEKIASGLLNPFIAHLKTAQDQIAEGGYSVLLQPESGSNATWFTKCTVESFVRFVSTPEILERVYTIESEILQIEEAIAIQGNNDIMIEDQHVKPLAMSVNEGNKPGHDTDEDKAIVLYKPGVQETSSSSGKEGNSKVQLLNVLETRKTVLKKEQGMAFARAVAAGFEIDHVANLLSFAECFGASRLMSACLRYMDLWKQKHDSGQWVEIEPEDAISTRSDYSAINASGIVLSSHNNELRSEATTPETKEKTSSDPNAGQFPHPAFPPWSMHSSPGYQAYHMQGMPYYQHYPGNGPFYPPPYPPMEDPHRIEQKRQSMDNFDSEESSEQHKNTGKMKSGKVVIRNINFINSKRQDSSEDDESASDTDPKSNAIANKKTLRSPKRKGKKETESDNGHWDAFQSFILKGAAEDGKESNEDMFSMERNRNQNPQKRQQKTMSGDDPLVHGGHADNIQGDKIDMQSYERNGRKIIYRNGNDDDFMVGGRAQANVRNSLDPLADSRFQDRNGIDLRGNTDEALMVSIRSSSGVNDNRITTINMDYDLSSRSQNPENKVNYEPHDLSLMPERGVEDRSIGYDPALDYEMQLTEDEKRRKESLIDVKKGSKSAEKIQRSKVNGDKKLVGPIRKGKPSKVNSTLEDAKARAEKLRSFKADLQKMKKEQQDAELKRLEGLKIERQKRIAARANSNSNSNSHSHSNSNSISTRKSLPSKLSPMSHKSSKFTDSEPGSSSPLQRSKIRSIGSTNSKKPSTNSKLTEGSSSNRMTKSMSSMSDTKKEVNSIVTPDSKASITRIRRLSDPKKINNNNTHPTTTTLLKTRSAEIVSKTKLSNGPEIKKISAIMSLDQSKAASLPELKIKTSKVSSNLSEKFSKMNEEKDKVSGVAKVNLNEKLLIDENPMIDKSVVMLEHKQPSPVTCRVSKKFEEDCVGIQKVEVVDKETISIQPSSCEVRKNSEMVESSGEKSYQAPVARVSSFEDPSTRNSEYAKAPQPQTNFVGGGTEKAYISDFNNLKLEKIPEVLEKPQVKEVKGFRRLLKLGKKSHTHSDTASGNDVASSGGVHTLKTLIAEDRAPTHGQKSSRHFSLLSSFRGEKKPTP